MKKIFTAIMVLMCLGLALPLTLPAAAVADSGTPSLMVKAKSTVEAGSLETVSVFTKQGRMTVPGASVYLVSSGNITLSSSSMGYNALLNEYRAKAQSAGVLLGVTSDNGTLPAAFPDAGRFLLVAVKDGYVPGFTRLTVTLANKKELDLKAPEKIEVNSAATFKVSQRYKGLAVAGAAVYAQLLSETAISGTKNGPGSILSPLIKADAGSAPTALQTAEGIRGSGTLLGYTDSSGQFSYTFSGSGLYALAALKDGYVPGFAWTRVTPAGQKKLGMEAPASAAKDQPVTFRVFEGGTGQAVENATLYGYQPAGWKWPPVMPPHNVAENVTISNAADNDTASLVIAAEEAGGLLKQAPFRPIYMGKTDTQGKVVYTFTHAGSYSVVAFKDGYLPAGRRININSSNPAPALSVSVTFNLTSGQPADIRVKDKSTSLAVPGVSIYVLQIGSIREMPATANNGKAQDEISRAREKGTLAGYTDDNGSLSFTFASPGRYIVAAVKDGYSPAFTYAGYSLPLQPLERGHSDKSK